MRKSFITLIALLGGCTLFGQNITKDHWFLKLTQNAMRQTFAELPYQLESQILEEGEWAEIDWLVGGNMVVDLIVCDEENMDIDVDFHLPLRVLARDSQHLGVSKGKVFMQGKLGMDMQEPGEMRVFVRLTPDPKILIASSFRQLVEYHYEQIGEAIQENLALELVGYFADRELQVSVQKPGGTWN